MTADKRRIDACLRACAGISTQNLEDNEPFIELVLRYNVALRERDALHAELDALRAELDALKRQEPYAFAVNFPESSRVELVHDLDEAYEDMIYEAYEVRKLYLAPGAKGE